MSFRFRNNPDGSNTDLLRILLNDCSSATAKFSDEALQWFVDNSANVWYAAAEAADTYAGTLAAKGSKSVGDLSITYGGTIGEYRAMSARFRARGARGAVPFAGGIFQSDKDTEKADSGRAAPAFAVGMHDYYTSTGY
jgi:hypothetical protein